jgi:hypothetical protein
MRCTKRLSISDVARALHFIVSGGAGAFRVTNDHGDDDDDGFILSLEENTIA